MYYRDGTYDDCPRKLLRWTSCLRSKVKQIQWKRDEAEALLLETPVSKVSGTHVFTFRPEYKAEARSRYNLEVPDQRAAQPLQPEPAG